MAFVASERENPTVPFATVGDLSMYHELHGDGPPVLHISGTGNDLRRSQPDRSPLNAHFAGLHYDQRGLGRTGRGDLGGRPPTMADFADDAAGLCQTLGWDRCHVVGTSFGGMVALHLALRPPGLVDRLVLNCTAPGGDHSSYPLHRLSGLGQDEAFEARTGLMDVRYDPTAVEPIPGFGVGHDELRQLMGARPEGEAAIGLAEQLEARRHHDTVARLGHIGSPTLVCAGRFDGIAPMANSKLLATRIPDAELAVFNGGHPFMVQDPSAHPRMIRFLGGN